MKFKLDSISTNGKPGELINIDLKKITKKLNIDFNCNKIFYLNDLNSTKSRGNHSNSNARELLICLNGSFEIKLNNGKKEETYLINKNEGIFVDKNIWLDFYNFKNCVILVFVDIEFTTEKKSIYNYEEFCKLNN